MSEAAIVRLLDVLLEMGPQVLDVVERWVAGARAKRVEEVRPETGHAQAAVDALRAGDPSMGTP